MSETPVVRSSCAVLVGCLDNEDQHEMPDWHPERPARLAAVANAVAVLRREGVVADLPGRDATLEELGRVHDRGYLDGLRDLCDVGGGELDPDTPVSSGSWSTAVRAAGTGLAAIEALRDGDGGAAFVAVRPPGHHALADRGMGFCLLNNVAVASAALVDGGERVVIVDWDLHHGNGTQAIFWDDPRVLYVSVHQWPAYPGTGRRSEIGGPMAAGTTVNVPLPPGATGDVALTALDEVAAPVIGRFSPDWVLISAGFDAHRDDPLGDLAWSAGDYALLTQRALSYAPRRGRTVAFLEGGYDLPALERSITATVATLAGMPLMPEPPTSGGPGLELVTAARRERQRILGDEL